MSSNDFFSLVEEYKKKKKKGITTTTSVRDEEESGEFWDLVDQYRGKDNIAPVSSQSIIKNAVREEIAPVSMAQKILGSGMDDETMLSSFSLAEFRAAKDEVSDRGDQVRLQSLFNQKLISNNAEIMSKTKMDGKEHSVLEEMNLLAKMDSGDEKDERKSAVLKKMEELGLSTDDYAMYAGDSNFSWENFGNWAGNAAMSGLASFNKGITSTVDLILGNPLKALGWENNPVSEIADYYSDIYDSYKFKTDLYAQKLGGGKGYDFASSAIEGTMGAVPNAILALMTAGTSMAGTAATTTSSLTTQAAYQSGNILTKAGLTTEAMMKNPQYWLSFARTYGTDYEEAKSMGASDTAAVLGATLTSLVNAGIEIGTDGLSGIQGLPQEIAEEGGSKLLKWAISNVEEGGEEGLQKFVNEVVAKTMYNHDLDILNPKEYLEEMAIGTISGAALGGGQIALQGASNAVGSAVQNYQDHQLTENEQKVVDKVVEDRIAEKEKDGTKLTKKEKSEIHEEVFQQMKKGYISIETIEEGLGDRSSYDALEKEAKEFDTLYNTATGQLSKAQQDRLAELEAKNNENPYKDALAKSKEQYSKGVFDMVKGDRLSESYREKDRVYQDFQADFDKYKGTKHEEAARKTLESAMKAGANNTNRVHDLVDMAAQISADTGRTFEFKSGEQIKNDFVERQTKVIAEMEKIPAAKRTDEQSKKLADLKDLLAKVQSGETVVNGDITSDGIVLNLDSGKPLNRTVGHEVTHSLENAKSYKELKDSLYAYAKSKGIDIDKELNTRKLMYEGVADADPEAELIADLVGDFLFTDSEYVRKLSTENQNVFQKFWDKIKYLCKVATAGSQEARELARVEKAFADAYREGGKNVDGTKHSISGINSETADTGRLTVAEKLLTEGVDSETIRQETGWFKGYDGMWRYEVNDSEMEITKNLTSPMFSKYVDGDPLKLDDVIKHDALFEAYPELRDTTVRLKRTLGKNIVGSYDAKSDTLYVSGSIYLSNDMVKEMLIHEIQHKIQNIEGFSRGSSPKYWETKGIGEAEYDRFVANSELEKARILRGLTSEERQDYLRYVETDRQIQAALGAVDTDAILRGDDTNAMNVLNSIEAIEAENDALYNKLYSADWFAKLQEIDNVLAEGVSEKLNTVFYKNTAGEIEARDVSKRVNYTDEQRKNIRPDIDRANVTFANNDNSLDYIGNTKDGRRCYQSGFDSSVSMDDRIAEFKKRIATIFNLGAVELKTDVKKIRVRGDRFTSKKNLFGDEFVRDGEKEAKINSLYDLADILATAKYDPTATAKEQSYANPAIAPKNKAHKDVKYWYKFRNEIVFDGVPYTVTFNIRDKGSEQYQYLIEFKENKTPGLNNTAVKSLLPTDQVSYEDNIAPIPENVKYSLSSMANTFFGDENMTAEQFKKADYRQTQGYKDYVDQCLNNYRQTRADFDEATARKSIEDSIEGIVKVAIAAKQAGYDIYDDSAKRSKKDSKKRLLFSSLEPNSDYFTSNDISTICDKRKNFAEIYDDIVRAEEAKGVPKGKRFFDNVDNYFAIHKIMADKGLTTPCRQCYVESMRKNLAPMANAFLRLVQETNPDNTANDQLYHQKGKQKGEEKTSNAATREFVLSELIAHPEYNMSVNDLTVETLTTADGLAQLKLQAPTIYEAFNSFYGQSKPKMPKGATPFRFGELTALLTDEKGKIKKSVLDKINSTGGFRLQSYSDFQIQNYTDVLQVLFEAGTLGLKGHAYTKVPAFLDATEGTNLKRNISIFMYKDGGEWKLDKNDSFPYDLEEIYDLVKADESGDTGIIAVSQNADMSAWIMANDYVGYGIPFHKSGLKMGTVRDTEVKTEDGRVIKGYSGTIDHTKQQTEVWAKAGDGHKAETKVKKGINIYSFWDFDNKSNLSKNELIEKNVKAYIDQCEMAGYLPKFRAYVMNNGKVLNDVLKYSKELGFVGEDATIEDISFQYKGYTIPYGYYKFLGDFGMFTPDGKASAQKTLSLENYDFDKAVKFFSDSETLRRNEILQQFANGEERQRYRDSDLTAGELQDIVKQKRREVAESVVGDIAPSMSLSSGGDQFAPTSSFDISGKDFRVKDTTQETVSEMESVAEESSVTEDAPVDVVEDETTTEDIDPAQEIKTVKERLSAKLTNSQTELANVKQLREESSKSFDEKIAKAQALLDSKKNQDTKVANNIKRRIERLQRLKADVDAEYAKRINDIESKVTKTNTELEKDHTKQDNLERAYARIDAQLEREKAALAEEFNQRRESLKDKNTYISQKASELYNEIRNLKKGVRASDQLGYLLDTGHDWSSIRSALVNIKHTPGERVNINSAIESIAREMLNEDYENSLYNLDDEYQAQVKQLEEDAEKSRDEARKAQQRVTRKNLHAGIVDKIKARFAENGFDFDSVLKKAKNLSTFATVDNTPQRVMEKSLGYKEGGVLADLTVNKVAQNETEGIKWLNSFTDRKSGLLANISKQYGIKPGSKASAAAQMYAEGFYVNDNNEIIQYGDAELAQDFKDAKVRENIKKLARDPRIRQIYDETLAMINESRVRNGYPEIPRLDNYFLHFRAMDDTFSRLGLPFNPNDIKAKDLPTDLNGVTADLKPGQPYFASAMHRTGKRTSFDLLGGLEKYLTSAKNQIYHIDDIQTLRALRNYVADTYGQANGLEGLDALTEEEAQDRIEKVYNSHLSTFAKFLNEEANILAGKTALIDRGLEGIIGRRGITFLNTVNGQVGSNMVGFNLSSSLTNFLPVAQTFAKTNKADFVKAFGQTVANKVGSVFGRSDGFTENSPVVIRRKGADRFHRTPYQKVGDLGYVFMSAVDDISTELVARTKYNELTRKGMDSQQAHYETDKWVSRLMGDRSLGQMPQIYNSKMLGLITKFQLEVRNQLDSQFYDTIQEAKVSNEDIQNRLERNAKTAAKVTSTFVQLAVAQHLFGMAFESVAGYNPAFDIIEVMIKALGWDDEEDSEDTALDNIEQGFFALLEDLPYTSTFTGGRIPIESALPIEQFVKGVDQYGNEKSRLETLGEVAPYYLLPGGYGQIKKTAQGLGMFSDEHPIAGSYTDSGALRFPVEDTWQNRLQAGLFGQYASQDAGYYFDNDIAPLKDKQIQEFIDVDMPIRDYWDYRKGLSGLDTLSEKADYIDSLDLTDEQKNILINNIADRKEDIDMSDYGKYGSFEEFDFAEKYPEKYSFFQENGITYQDYASADEEGKRAYTWASENPGKYEMSKAISDDFLTYWQYKTELGDLEGDKDANGKTISGSKKSKVISYINDMDLDYGQKIILFKSEYNSDDTYNYDIIEYLNNRSDITYKQMETILKVLGFNVDAQGNITWD